MIFVMYECEERIGYSFKDKTLLRTCFTHSSYSHEHACKNNELLEFFGDAVLEFVVTEYLFSKFRDEDEGKLTAYRQQIVSRKPLAQAIMKLGLNEYILYGEGEKKNTPEHHEASCENLYEALVAGIYLDGGEEEARKFIGRTLLNRFRPDKKPSSGEVKHAAQIGKSENYKGRLQEFVQKNKLGEIEYKETGKTGPAHDPVFTVAVFVGENKLGEASGKKKSGAEQDAATIALQKLTGGDGTIAKREKQQNAKKKPPEKRGNTTEKRGNATEKRGNATVKQGNATGKQRGGNKNQRKNPDAVRKNKPGQATDKSADNAAEKTVNKTANNTLGKRKSPANRKGERIK